MKKKKGKNWCSEKPLGDWEDITTNREGMVVNINLSFSGLKGVLPASICKLMHLTRLNLGYNDLTGSIDHRQLKRAQGTEYLEEQPDRIDSFNDKQLNRTGASVYHF